MAGDEAGRFCWNELMTADPEAAGDFYSRLLGWSAVEKDLGEAGRYTIFKRGDEEVAGMMALPDEDLPPHWMPYVGVPDVDEAAARTEELGGTVLVPPTDIPEVGRFSVIKDPTGAVLSLYAGLGQ